MANIVVLFVHPHAEVAVGHHVVFEGLKHIPEHVAFPRADHHQLHLFVALVLHDINQLPKQAILCRFFPEPDYRDCLTIFGSPWVGVVRAKFWSMHTSRVVWLKIRIMIGWLNKACIVNNWLCWIRRSDLIDFWNVNLKIGYVFLGSIIKYRFWLSIIPMHLIIESEDPHLNTLQLLCIDAVSNHKRLLF